MALRYATGPWTIDGVLDFAYGGVALQRTIPLAGIGMSSATSHVFDSGLHLRAAYTVPMHSLYLEPELQLDATYVRIDGYTETGAAPFALSVKALQSGVFAATPGVRIGNRLALGPGSAANLYAGAGIGFLADSDFSLDAQFASVGKAGGSVAPTRTTASSAGLRPELMSLPLVPGRCSSSIAAGCRPTKPSMAASRGWLTVSEREEVSASGDRCQETASGRGPAAPFPAAGCQKLGGPGSGRQRRTHRFWGPRRFLAQIEHPARQPVTRFHGALGWPSQIAVFLMLGLLVTPHELPPVILPVTIPHYGGSPADGVDSLQRH